MPELANIANFISLDFFKSRFTPSQTEQRLRGTELQEQEPVKD